MKIWGTMTNSLWVAVCVLGLVACGEQPGTELEQQDAEHMQGQPIINGDPAGELAKSVQGAIVYQSGSTWRAMCGCVYIGQNSQGQHWAATAAHCADALESGDRFAFGGLDLADYSTSNTVGWTQAIRHPGWDSNDLVNDIAAIRLSGSPPNGSAVTLATSSTDASAGETVTISGYGLDEEPSLWCLYFGWNCPEMPGELLQADTTVFRPPSAGRPSVVWTAPISVSRTIRAAREPAMVTAVARCFAATARSSG
jgi:hypothetical protein